MPISCDVTGRHRGNFLFIIIIYATFDTGRKVLYYYCRRTRQQRAISQGPLLPANRKADLFIKMTFIAAALAVRPFRPSIDRLKG